MSEELFSKLFVFRIFTISSVLNDVINFIFDILELNSKTLIEFVISVVTILSPDDFNKLLEILFDILVISKQNEDLFEVLSSLSKGTADDIELAHVLLFDEIVEFGDNF